MSEDDKKAIPGPQSSSLAEPAVTEHGGRVELRFSAERCTTGTVVYAARWFVAGVVHEGWAQIDASSTPQTAPTVQITAEALPGWLASFTETLLRTSARTVLGAGVDFDRAPWPRRLTRWRAAPAPKT